MAKHSSAMASDTPMARPSAASAATQPRSVAALTVEASTAGQRENREKVKASARAIRAGSIAARSPGRGTKTRAPETRARTRRKAYSVPAESVSSAGIASQVPEERRGVGHHLLKHPGQE